MSIPEVKQGDWITIGSGSLKGYVFDIHNDGSLGVGYYQNRMKAIKEDVIWDGTRWQFQEEGPNGTYLRGQDEAIVKRGP